MLLPKYGIIYRLFSLLGMDSRNIFNEKYDFRWRLAIDSTFIWLKCEQLCVHVCFFSIIFFLIFHIVWLPKKQRKRKTKNNIHRTCSLSHKFISVFRTLSDDFSYSVDQYYSLFGSLDRHFFENIEPGRYRKHEAIPHCKIFMLCFFIGWLFAMRTSHVMFFGIVLTI